MRTAQKRGAMKHFSIAIDGPAGAGKSTIAKILSKQLGFVYVDTGAMYRAMALYFIRSGIKPEDEEKINNACNHINIGIEYDNNEQQVILNGENVTGQIRTEEVSHMASKSSVYPSVRLKLVELQRELAKENDVVMDGRDIASYVLPGADLKVYLTASTDVRAGRRCLELNEKGIQCSIEEIKKEIEERDYRDSHREFAPLTRVQDAIEVDSSDMTPDKVADCIREMFRQTIFERINP